MKKHLCLIILLAFAITANANIKITVVDALDNEPVQMATVFAQSGIIVGYTDSDGTVNVSSLQDFPLTIRCLGYETAQCGERQREVKLKSSSVMLKEVVITPTDRPIARIICYVRNYLSGINGADTIKVYEESMADFFAPTREKIKGFKKDEQMRFLHSRKYTYATASKENDSISGPKYTEEKRPRTELLIMPIEQISETKKISEGATTDIIAGKHGIKQRVRKTDKSYIISTDILADTKNHNKSIPLLKLIGLTVNINELQGSWIYRTNKLGKYDATDIESGTFSLSIQAKGKLLKKALKTDEAVQLYCFYEIYPIGVEYLTVEEAKSEQSKPTIPEWQTSPKAKPLDPSIQKLISAAKNSL